MALKGAYNNESEKIFSGACCNRTRGDGSKVNQGQFRLDVRKTRVVKHWKRLSRGVVHAPSLKTFKVRLGGVLNNLK